MTGHFLGIDGGGTHTRAVALGPHGQLLGVARAGGGNFQVLGLAGLVQLFAGLQAELQVALLLDRKSTRLNSSHT